METLEYYGLHAHCLYVLLLFVLMVLLVWEGNRLVKQCRDWLRQRVGGRVHSLVISFG